MAPFCPKVFSSIAEIATQWMDVDLVSSADSFEVYSSVTIGFNEDIDQQLTGYIYKYTWGFVIAGAKDDCTKLLP